MSAAVIVKRTKKNKVTTLTIDEKKALWKKFEVASKDSHYSVTLQNELAVLEEIDVDMNPSEAKVKVDISENLNVHAADTVSLAYPNSSDIKCIYPPFRLAGNERDVCDCCHFNLAFTDEGYMACTNKACGVMYTDTLDHSAEWRFYGADDCPSGGDPTRCGMPANPLLKESSAGCKVLCTSKSSFIMRKIKRYTEWQSWPYKEKTTYEDFQRISVMAEQGGIPKIIIDDAMRYHKKISEAKTFRGLNRDGIIAATIYVAARINRYPRTAREIAAIFHLDNTSATKGCKNALSIINEIEHEMSNDDKTSLSSATPTSFLDRYCSRLNMNFELTQLCKFVAMRTQESNLLSENTPHSIAAGIIYFVAHECRLAVSKKDVNIVCEISEVTINKCCKKLEGYTVHLIPSCIRRRYQTCEKIVGLANS